MFQTSLIFLIFSSFCLAPLHGATFDKIQILEVSPSHKSFIGSRGGQDGLKLGEYGSFLVRVEDKLQSVVMAELVKVYPERSFWYVRDEIKPSLLKRGAELVYTTEQVVLSGLDAPRVYRKMILTKENGPFNKTKNGFPRSLLTEGEQFLKSDSIKNSSEKLYYDLKITEVSTIPPSKERLLRVDRRSGLPSSAIDADYRHQVLGTTVDGIVRKYAGLEFGQKDLYANEDRDDAHMRNQGQLKTALEEFNLGLTREGQIDSRAIAKVEKEGELWSANLTQDELRNYLIDSGVEREARVRYDAMKKVKSHEFFLNLNASLNKTTSPELPASGGLNKSFDVGYEYHLYRTSEYLDRFSLMAFGGAGTSYYRSLDYNVQSDEVSYGLGANFYFIGSPSEMNSWLAHIGPTLRFGSSTIHGKELQEKYQYDIGPSLGGHLGLKYRLSARDQKNLLLPFGIGFSLMFSTERKSLEAKSLLNDNLYQKINVVDNRVSLGMQVYF